ncbi:nuclear receptor-binding factor 2-like, partial [Anneissia japonica]|uniref:nuclear receptor-binding factor 2-like n=1 Tax=Anneissia japonica TaxID=1529436 RepID=UPI0014256C1B
ANQQERRVEKFLLSRQYDEAIKCHKKAAEYLLEAIEKTESLEIRQMLQLKHDHHTRQPALLEETQRREKRKKQLLIEMSQRNEEKDINANETNAADTDNTDGGLKNTHSEEQYDSVENADSLLHVLKENSKEEDGNVTYRTPYLLSYLKSIPLASWISRSKEKPIETFSMETCSKRPSFEKDKIIHKLQVTIMTLAKDLYNSEEENKYLKEKVSSLEMELERNRCSRDNVQGEESPLLGSLNLPFSTDMDDTSNLDTFQLHSLQPLPELDMPENQ